MRRKLARSVWGQARCVSTRLVHNSKAQKRCAWIGSSEFPKNWDCGASSHRLDDNAKQNGCLKSQEIAVVVFFEVQG